MQAPAALAPVLSEEESLREVRRQNLLLLTQLPGTKTQLGRLTGLSAANVSHRLHGNKIFDRATADLFSEKLGLPENWFETPQSPESLPQVALEKLLDKNSVPFESKLVAKPVVAAKPKPGPALRNLVPPNLAPARQVAQGTLNLSSSALGRTAHVPPPEVAATPFAAVAAAPSPTPAPAPAPVRAASPVVHAAPLASRPAPLEPTGVLGPIVLALMRTLELKAQEGRLSEEHALQLLVDVATF
jgi:hypothetical protein